MGTERTLRGKFCGQLNDCQLVRHHQQVSPQWGQNGHYGEIWVTLRGKFCDQLNDCQLVRHHLNFNYKGKESILFITLFRPPQPHCSYQSCARAFGLNIMHLLFFVLVFVTSLFNVQRSNNYNDYHVWLSVPLSSICPSVFNISTPLEGFP